MELQMLRKAVDTIAGHMLTQGERLEECLLDIPEHVRDAVEYGVHRGAAVALAVDQVWSSHELHFLADFSDGEEVVDHERLIEDFDEAMDAIVTEVPVEEVILEAL
jgi:hypothetical protein